MRPGLTEILIILGIALLLFGAGRLADIGKGLGEGIRNFKKGLSDDDKLPEGKGKADKLPEGKGKGEGKAKANDDDDDDGDDDDAK